MRIWTTVCTVTVLAGPLTAQPSEDLSFVVLGHIRSSEHNSLFYLMDELLSEVASLEPDFVALTGDIIQGTRWPQEYAASVRAEWNRVDSALATLGVPIHRAPGGHDIKDLVTRDIYTERYGRPPHVVDYERTRHVLLSSAWIPADGDERYHPYNRITTTIDSAQVSFLRQQLADTTSYDHAFVYMHHTLWWKADSAPWWQEVHPILAASGKVRAVFTGDWGPQKFSHARRDGVDYYQSSMSLPPSLGSLRGHEWNRILAQQFDNFLYVTVSGNDVKVQVKALGAVSSGHFTPDRWRDIYGRITRPSTYVSGRERLRLLLEHPKGRVAVIGGGVSLFLIGGLVGWGVSRRRSKTIQDDPQTQSS